MLFVKPYTFIADGTLVKCIYPLFKSTLSE